MLFLYVSFWLGGAPSTPTSEPAVPRSSVPTRARVIVVEDPRAVVAFSPVAEVVDAMVQKGLLAATGKANSKEAWLSLISTQDTIGLKVLCASGRTSGTRPSVVAAVVKTLLAAGVPPGQIVIWDKRLGDLRMAGFGELAERYGVQLAGSLDEGFDGKSFYDTPLLGHLVWGDYEFGKKGDELGRKSFVSKLLTQRLTKIVNITPLLNHNLAEVSGNLYGLAMGSVDNTLRFEAVSNPVSQLGQVIPEIYALPELGDRVVFNIVDALICQYQGEDRTLLHYSNMLNQLRFGTDPVALDVLSILELDRQRQLANIPPVKVHWQIYTNAAFLELGVSDPRLIDVIKMTGTDKEAPARP